MSMDQILKIKENTLIKNVINSKRCKKRTAYTKRRGELAYSGSPLFKQKGGGRARARYSSMPSRRGGAKAHGPSNIERSKKVNKKVLSKSITILINRHMENKTWFVIDDFQKDIKKTKDVELFLKNNVENFNKKYSFLLVHNNNQNLYVSSKNIKNITTENCDLIGSSHLLNNRTVILEKSAADKIYAKYNILGVK